MVRRLRTLPGALGLLLMLNLSLAGLAAAQPEPAPLAPDIVFEDSQPYEEFDDYDDSEALEEGHAETDLDAVARAHAAYLGDGELQRERPEMEIEPLPPPPPPPSWLRSIAEFLESLGPLFRVVFWLAVALVIGGLLYFLFGEAIRMRFGGKPKPKDTRKDDILVDLRPDATAARSLLEEADALARQGRFAEAVHLLLFRSIEDIQQRLEGGVPTSLTAREIASLSRLPERARRTLRPIIQVVERSFFGGRDVDADGWQEARRSYQDFAFGEGWT